MHSVESVHKMHATATDGVGRKEGRKEGKEEYFYRTIYTTHSQSQSVDCLSVCWSRSWALQKRLNWTDIELYRCLLEGNSSGSKELQCSRWESKSPTGRGSVWRLFGPFKNTKSLLRTMQQKNNNSISLYAIKGKVIIPSSYQHDVRSMRLFATILWLYLFNVYVYSPRR